MVDTDSRQANSLPPSLTPLFQSELLARLQPGDAVLDLGCGKGTFAYNLYPDLRINAVDIAPPETQFPSHVTFRLGTAEKLPYDDQSFKLIIAHFVFEHFADFAAALKEADRVLSRDGLLYMALPDARSFDDQLYRAIFAGGGHLQQPTLEWVIREVYRNTSLKLISYADWPAGMSFLGDHEEMRTFVFAVLNAFQRTTGDDLRARSSYVMLFRKETGIGYRTIMRTCTYCGEGDGVDVSAPLGSEAGNWICPACGCTNTLTAHGSEIDLQRLSDDVTRFETEFGGRLSRSASGFDRAAAPGLQSTHNGLFSPVEVQELRWLAKLSLWFRSHLRLYYFLRRVKRLVTQGSFQ